MLSTESVRLGIIGLGNMGRAHAQMIIRGEIPGLELTAVSDLAPERLAPFGSIAQFPDPRQLLASGTVDAVLIATPHFSHTDLGIRSLEAGLHVLVEKPISATKADCERLLAAYRPAGGQVFAAMFNQRTDPRYQQLKALIEAGELGRLQRIHWTITDWFRTEHYYRSGGWRATWGGEGGGVLLNQCPHQLDLWQWLFGLPSRVIARCQFGQYHDIEVEDAVSALFEYDTGVLGVFASTTGEAPGTNRLEVAGENGLVIIEANAAPRFLRNEISSREFSRTSPELFARPPHQVVELPEAAPAPQHRGILQNFVAAIQGREPLLAPAQEGIRSVELANAMLLSAWLDRPVTLPMDAHLYQAELDRRVATSRYRPDAGPRLAPVADLRGSF